MEKNTFEVVIKKEGRTQLYKVTVCMSSLEERERETTRGIEARTPGFFESIL